MSTSPTPAAPSIEGAGQHPADFLDRIVAAARSYLGADISFLSEFEGEEKVVRNASGPAQAMGLAPGTRFALDTTYCHRVVHGVIPEVIYDTRIDGRVSELPITHQLGIRSYIGVPVRAAGSDARGTLCCVNFDAERSERDRDLGFMRFLAELVGRHLDHVHAAEGARRARLRAVRAVLDADGPRMVFQPVVELASGAIVGAEALARFDAEPVRTPDAWFRDAWDVGLGAELELSAVRAALAQIDALPAGAYLSVNLSPAALDGDALFEVLGDVPAGRVIVEITEHAAVEDYARLMRTLDRLRASGVRLAIDDLGAGYSSLRHLLQIAPHMAKLDMSLTRGIDTDEAKRALTQAVMNFARDTALAVVAEGIETEAEARAVHALGLRYGQGFHYWRPQALPFAG